MKVQGKVIKINDEQIISEKFKKREFVVKTEGNYPEFLKLQVTQERCDLAEKLSINDNVVAYINLKGKEYTNKNGDVDYFVSIDCWKIDKEPF